MSTDSINSDTTITSRRLCAVASAWPILLQGIAIVCLYLPFTASAGNTLVELATAKPQSVQFKATTPPETATCTRRGKEIIFTLSGKAGARVRWEIPVNSRYVADWELAFSVRTDNIASIAGRPNIAVSLEQRQPRAPVPAKTVPVFRSMGRSSREVGTATFSTIDRTHAVRAIVFDLSLGSNGHGTLLLSTLQLSVEDNLLPADAVDRILKTPPPTKAEVVVVKGMPKLKIDGADVVPMGFETTNPQPAIFALAGTGGLKLNRLKISTASLWRYPRYFDYAQLEERLARACMAEDAWLILDIDLTPAAESIRQWEKQEKAPYSDFSPSWRHHAATALLNVLAAVRRRPVESKHIVGVSISTGIEQAARRDRHPEYVQAFRGWLQKQHGSLAGLRKAWKDDKVTFDTAAPSPPTSWPTGFLGPILNPMVPRRHRDSRDFYFQSRAQTLLNLNRLVKETTNRQYLCGFNDPSLLVFDELGGRRHLSAGSVYDLLKDQRDVDFVEQPFLASTSPVLLHLLSRRGKLGFLHGPFGERQGKIGAVCAHAETLHSFPVVTPREAMACIRGVQRAELQTALQMLCAPRPQAQIAVVVDPAVFADLGPRNPVQMPWQSRSLDTDALAARTYHSWFEIGAPFDIIPIDEFKPGKYRMIIFSHTLRMTDKRIKLVRAAQGGRRTIVWTWANGLLHDTGMRPSSVGDLCGMRIAMRATGMPGDLTPGDKLQEFTRSNALKKLGTPTRITPAFIVTDKQASVLATFRTGEAAIAVRDHGKWTSIYSASPYIDPEILRAAALKSGVDVYLRGVGTVEIPF